MACANICVIPLPPPVFPCTSNFANGGISRIIFAACNVEFKNITDPAEWCTYIKRGAITMTADIMGQMPKGNAIKKKVSACRPERKIGMDKTVTFMDYNIDTLGGYRDWDFWYDISTREASYKVGFLTCDGRFYGFIDQFTIEVDQVIEDSSTGSTFWDGVIGWNSFFTPQPIMIPNHIGYLNGDCEAVPNFSLDDVFETNAVYNGGAFFTRYKKVAKILCDSSYITLDAGLIAGVGAATYTFTGPNTIQTANGNIPIDPSEPIVQSGGNNILNIEVPYNANSAVPNSPPEKTTYHCAIDITDFNSFNSTNNNTNFDPNPGIINHGIDAFVVFEITDIRPSFISDTANQVVTTSYCAQGINEFDLVINYENPLFHIFEFQLQINGVPGPWLDNGGVYENVIPGIHVVLIKDTYTGCINQKTIEIAPCP